MSLKLDKLLFVFLAFTFFYYEDNYWRSVWWDRWFFTIAICAALFARRIWKRYHWSVGLFAGVLLGSALWVFGWRNSYPNADLQTLVAMGKIAAYAFISVVGLGLLAMDLTPKGLSTMGDYLAFTCFANAAIILYQTATGHDAASRGGALGNPSMSGCYLAFTYPFLVLQERERIYPRSLIAYAKRLVYVLAPVAAIILTKSSQPVGVLAVVLVAWWAAKERNEARFIPVTGATFAVALAVLWVGSDVNNEVFSSSGRFTIWRQALGWWWENGHIWTGQGTGTSHILLPYIERLNLTPDPSRASIDWWLWFHSDWLQTLFENGVIGLVAAVTMYGYALYFAWHKRPWLFAAVCGVGATALFNFPAHFPMHAVASVLVLTMAFDRFYLWTVIDEAWLERAREEATREYNERHRVLEGRFYDDEIW